MRLLDLHWLLCFWQ